MPENKATGETKAIKSRKARTPVPSEETDAQRFSRLASNRVSRALKAISLCGNLARYEHTDEQTQRIIAALSQEVEGVGQAFAKPERNKSIEFRV